MNRLRDVSKRTIGVNFLDEGKASIRVWSPEAKAVEIVVEGRGEGIALQRQDLGYWQIITGALKEGDRYRVRLNGDATFPDPTSLSQPGGVHEASEAINPTTFQWSDRSWNNYPLAQYIIYELHTGTFTPEGTFEGIEGKLDHLKALGITAIEIMPVAQFPGSRNWGYDGVYPFAVQNSYGGARGLQSLVDACHRKGIAVILDVVYNHLGPEGNYMGAFGPAFTEKYKTPWGSAINFDDAWCDGIRDYFIENALMWLRDFHIDALRLDAVHAIKDLSPTHFLRELKEHVVTLMQETGRTHYLVAECDLNDTRFINPLGEHGYGMDAQWIDEFHHALRTTTSTDRQGYYSDFDGLDHLAKAYKDAYVYDGQFSPHRKKLFGEKTGNAGQQFVVFSQNHDQVGNRMLGERTSQLVSFEVQKVMAGAVMIAPYLPMLFMGEEWGEPHPFLYFVSHADEVLAAAVRKGRKEEFAAFHAEGEAPDPVAEETFQQSKLQWELRNEGPHKVLLDYYTALIALRKAHPSLHCLERKQLQVECNKEKGTLTLHRWYGDEHALCLLNFSQEQQSVMPPAKDVEWHKAFDSADVQWSGTPGAPQPVSAAKPAKETITIQPQSIIIYFNHV